MTKIFIDTNIFLGLYESSKDTIEIFKDIEKLQSKLVFSRQVYDEFLRNRDQILRRLIHGIETVNKVEMHSTSLIQSSTEYKQLKEIKTEFNKINQSLIQKIKEMSVDNSKDTIFSQFTQLYNSTDVMRIERSDTLIHRAFFRKLAGNPPISSKKDTIGDEIIWESLLEHVADDLILISRDSTYKEYSTFLTDEYRNRTKKSLFIVETLSDALKYVGEEPSDKLVQFEEEQKKYTYRAVPEISDTLKRLSSLSENIDRSYLVNLGSIAKTMDRSYLTTLDKIAEMADRSYLTTLDNIAEMADRSYFTTLDNIAKAMDVSPAFKFNNMVERMDISARRFSYPAIRGDFDTIEQLERSVEEDPEECTPNEPSHKKDCTKEGTQVATRTDEDTEH